MSEILAAPLEQYLTGLHRRDDPILDAVGRQGHEMKLPIVSADTGALLELLVTASGARRILEIGTAIGYSALWMARALPADGMLITIERDASRAAVARENFARAGLADRISVIVGDAGRYLHKVAGPFDLIFQDGDKLQYEPMLDRLLALLRPGGLLVTDNALWSGEVVPGLIANPWRPPETTAAITSYNQRLATDPRVVAMVLPIGDGVSVGGKKIW